MNDSKMEINHFGTKCWFNLNGRIHRENGPAVIQNDGSSFWYVNDKHHRIDGPSNDYVRGRKYWYIKDQFIREFKYDQV